MVLFFLIFFLLYGSLHAYFFLKARAAFGFDPLVSAMLLLALALLTVAPLIIHYLESEGIGGMARLLGYVGYVWMGLLFIFLCTGLLVDFISLLIAAVNPVLPGTIRGFSAAARFWLPCTLSLAIGLYGFFDARNVRAERITVFSRKIPAHVGTLKILQLSDVHLGLLNGGGLLRCALDRIAAEQPDLVVSTGDLVDREICRMPEVMELLRGIQPRLGKFAVTGNHEYYAGLDRALDCIKQAGFRILRGDIAVVSDIIAVAGVDDPEGKSFHNYADVPEEVLLSSVPGERFTLLLKHRPAVSPAVLGAFDLQLSGHTHNGQIFPFSLLVRAFYPFMAGLYDLGAGSRLYTSRGTGTWGPPIRFLAPPEITVIELRHGEAH